MLFIEKGIEYHRGISHSTCGYATWTLYFQRL